MGLLQDVFLIRNAWAQKYFEFQIISHFCFLMCVHTCVEVHVFGLYCSYALVFKAGPLNHTQSTLMWLILLVSLLWGSRLCLLGCNYGLAATPIRLLGLGTSSLMLI